MKLVKTDSFELATYLRGDQNASKLALVIPGKLDTKDYPHMRSHVNFLASKGYLALSFDPPGTWESPGDIQLYTITNTLKAIDELIQYFGNKPTFVMGHSRGGSVAMYAAIANPTITHFASVMSAYSHKSTFVDEEWKQTGYKLSKRDLPGNQNKSRQFKLPYSCLEDQTRYDASEGLKQSNKPKLFIYGNQDILIDPKIVKAAYTMSADPKTIHSIDSAHDYRFHPDMIREVNEYIGKFLKSASI